LEVKVDALMKIADNEKEIQKLRNDNKELTDYNERFLEELKEETLDEKQSYRFFPLEDELNNIFSEFCCRRWILTLQTKQEKSTTEVVVERKPLKHWLQALVGIGTDAH
jgi:ElaB/YqjD/DUF883 family membrane-anchored ribosome-binding protein